MIHDKCICCDAWMKSALSIPLQRSGLAPVIFLFIVDTCQDEENLQALKVYTLSIYQLSGSPIYLSLLLTHAFFCVCVCVCVCVVWFAGVSSAVSESNTTHCSCGPHHLRQDGLFTHQQCSLSYPFASAFAASLYTPSIFPQ